MADSSRSFPARSLLRAVSASLRLANESADSLSVSQLSAMQHKLRETLGIVDGKIQARQKPTSENQKVVIDISDWEDSDTDNAADEQMETSEEEGGSLPIPKPYPTALPQGQEEAETYYVVDCGREVGIFTDNVISTRAVCGVPRGHQVKLKTWYDAATHYNSLWDQGLIVRVPI